MTEQVPSADFGDTWEFVPPPTAAPGDLAPPAAPGHPSPTAGPGDPPPEGAILERPHPLTPMVRGWIVLVALLYGFLQNLTPGRGPDQQLPPWWVIAIGIAGIALVAGLFSFASWWFTRFVIDDREVRVETGWLSRRSRRVPFERIQSVDIDQPLLARLFGLAEIRIEAGAEGSTSLRYLPRARAYGLRDYLMARAAGERLTVAESEARRAAGGSREGLLVDARAEDRVLVAVPGGRIVGAFLLSGEVWFSVAISVAAIIGAIQLEAGAVSLAVVFPILLGLVGLVSRRLIHQFNFRLLESPDGGLRVTSGLTRLVSQSVPRDRIQGVAIRQPLLWRIPGWWRVDIDMVGISASSDSGENSRAESTVLPVGTAEEQRFVLGHLLPGIDTGAVELQGVPSRVRWLRWFDKQTLRWGADSRVAIAHHGLFQRRGTIVPLHKFQSVRVTQGPLQRRLDLASVHLDTTPGPVNSVARHLPGETARAYALSLVRAGHEAR